MPSKTTASRNNKDKRCSPAQTLKHQKKKKKKETMIRRHWASGSTRLILQKGEKMR